MASQAIQSILHFREEFLDYQIVSVEPLPGNGIRAVKDQVVVRDSDSRTIAFDCVVKSWQPALDPHGKSGQRSPEQLSFRPSCVIQFGFYDHFPIVAVV